MCYKRQYYKSGNLKSEGRMVDGLKDGKWVYYYKNGFKMKEVHYKNGVEEGEWKMWYETGIINIEQNKINGKSNGYWREFYENGKLKEIGKYVNDEYYPIDFWDENGTQLLTMGNGKKLESFGFSDIDIYEEYYENGILIKREKISKSKYLGFKKNNS